MFHIHIDLINRLKKDKQDWWLCYEVQSIQLCAISDELQQCTQNLVLKTPRDRWEMVLWKQ